MCVYVCAFKYVFVCRETISWNWLGIIKNGSSGSRKGSCLQQVITSTTFWYNDGCSTTFWYNDGRRKISWLCTQTM